MVSYSIVSMLELIVTYVILYNKKVFCIYIYMYICAYTEQFAEKQYA